MVTLPTIPVLPTAAAALVGLLAAAGTAAVWTLAEGLHRRRTRGIARLAFGETVEGERI